MSHDTASGDVFGEQNRRTLLGMIGTASFGLVAGCLGSGADETVTVGPDGDAAFEPQTLEVVEEDTVEFVWESDGHTLQWDSVPDLASDVRNWDGVSDPEDEGHTYSQELLIEGTYEYSCDQHDGMEGTIEVVSG